MADLPFGFSSGEDPDRDKSKKEPGPGSSGGSSDPFGFGNAFGGPGGAGMPDLGQIFTQLGAMFSGAGASMNNPQAGPVNYDLARKLASNSIGFVKPVPEQTVDLAPEAKAAAEREKNRKPDEMPEMKNPLTDMNTVDAMMDQAKKSLVMMVPQTAIMGWINFFFSGFDIHQGLKCCFQPR